MSLESSPINEKEEELTPELKEAAKHHKGGPLGVISKKIEEIIKKQDELLK